MARSASTNSRILAAGSDHGMLNRRWMWALIWEPRPRTKRPELNDCRSFATMARVIGLRANATATAVPSVNVQDWPAASSSGRKGSRLTSVVQTPS